MYTDCNINCPLFVSELGETLNFMDKISKNFQISNLMTIRPSVAEMFHTDGDTEYTKLIVNFRCFLERA
jgi:hypothetical protein